MEKIFRTIKIRSAYMFNLEMQALVEVMLQKVEYNINTGHSSQIWRVANTDKTVKTSYHPAKETQPEQFTGKLYKTLEDFEKGLELPLDAIFFDITDEGTLCDNLCRYMRTNTEGAYIWVYEKGEAAKWFFRSHIDFIYCDYSEGSALWSADEEIPKSYFDSEEVYKYNDYRFIDTDGKEQVREGVYNRLRLDPDQEALADKLQNVINECKEAGMKIYFNLCDYNLRAVNVRRVERIEYGPEVDEETERAYVFEDTVGRTFSDVYDLNTKDDEIEFVIKK